MPTNPYQSPEERGAAESRPPRRNWWKLACLFGLTAAPVSAAVCLYFLEGIADMILFPHGPGLRVNTDSVGFALRFCALVVGAIGFVVGGIGWLL
jgi:hypothetical protein